MIPAERPRSALAVLVSGGLDSAILLGEMLRAGKTVHPLYVRHGLIWESEELRQLRRFLEAVRRPALQPLHMLDMPVTDLYGDHRSITGRGVPDADSPDAEVFLPGRNVLLLAKAMLLCHLHGVQAVALAPLGSNPFADATPAFFDAYQEIVNRGLGGDVLGTPFDPTPAGGSGLKNDGTQYIFNWDTKNVAVGTYRILLTLADGTVQTKTLQIVTKGGYNGLLVDGTTGATTVAGGLLAGDITLYVDNSSGLLTSDELARIDDAVAGVDAIIGAYGVTIMEVSDSASANVVLDMGSSSAAGGSADGVLGCTTDGEITFISGWNWYAGSDATQIGSNQYDFETVVTHELGHALGLGHSTDSTSVMYATLNTGTVNRSLTTADLNVPDSDTTGACGLHAAVNVGRISNPSYEIGGPEGGRISNPSYEDGRDMIFALVATQPDGLPLGSRQLLSRSGEPSRTGSVAGDAAFTSVLAEWPPTQDLALTGAKSNSLIFAAQPPREEDDALFDAPLFPEPRQDGEWDSNKPGELNGGEADPSMDYLAASPALLEY